MPVTVAVLLFITLALSYGIGRQLGHPTGWVGRRLMGRTLNTANKTMLDAAVDALGARRGERIADVGFGGGYALERIREHVSPARPVGVEISLAMLDAARERWGEAVELHTADVAALPFPDGSLDGGTDGEYDVLLVRSRTGPGRNPTSVAEGRTARAGRTATGPDAAVAGDVVRISTVFSRQDRAVDA